MDGKARAEAIRGVAAGALQSSDVAVDDVTIHPAGKRRLVRVTVARDISGLDADDQSSPVPSLGLDEIAAATRRVSGALDESEAIGSAPYTLEVSSPGVGAPLRSREQLRRNVGRLLTVHRRGGVVVQGRLAAVGADELRLDGVAEPFPVEDVVKATVQLEFSRPKET